MSTSRWFLALFLALLSLHLGQSMELPAVTWIGAGISVLGAFRLVRIERPTWGLLFVLFVSGIFLGNQALEDWAVEGSWPQSNGMGAGFLLSFLTYLLWVFAAKPAEPAEAGSGPLDRDSQNILGWGLLFLLLMTPPESTVVNGFGVQVPLIPLAAIVVASLVLFMDRCADMWLNRLALLLPLLVIAPLSLMTLQFSQAPVIGLLGDLFPRSRNFTPTGFSPNQQLRASVFLRPSNRAVLRIQSETPPEKYLAGNRLTTLNEDLVWLAEERPQLALTSFDADQTASGDFRYPLENHQAEGDGSTDQTLIIRSLTSDNYIFVSPGTRYVTGRFDSLQRNAADVWTPNFERGADRRWQLEVGGAATPDTERDANLQMPAAWNASLQARSETLTGATTDDTVENVLAYFQSRPYALSTNFDPVNPLQDFFLNDRAGYCFWFATASTLALRANGIPSRLVSGYVIHEQLAGNLWLVRERDAHSWVEWQDDQGYWHTIDPTPGSLFGFFGGYRSSALSLWYHRLAGQWQILLERILADALTANLIAWGGLLILAFLFVREYRRIRRANARGGSQSQRWQKLWQRFLSATKLPDNPDWTAATYAENLPAAWPEPWKVSARRFLQTYNSRRFSRQADPLMDVEQALRHCIDVFARRTPTANPD